MADDRKIMTQLNYEESNQGRLRFTKILPTMHHESTCRVQPNTRNLLTASQRIIIYGNTLSPVAPPNFNFIMVILLIKRVKLLSSMEI